MLLDWLVVLKTLRPMFCRKGGGEVCQYKKTCNMEKKEINLFTFRIFAYNSIFLSLGSLVRLNG